MFFQTLPVWKKAPFVRLIIPFMAGISSSWYLHCRVIISWLTLLVVLMALVLSESGATFRQFKYNWIRGILLNILILSSGQLLTSYNDYTDQIETFCAKDQIIVAGLEEAPSERLKTFKIEASIQSIIRNDSFIKVERGNIIIYLDKNALNHRLDYGNVVLFKKPLLPIKNSGNPGSFDYRQYCAFQHIYYEVFLHADDFIVLPVVKANPFKKYLLITQRKIICILKTFMRGGKETGLAEALLIGYRDDLDKALVQSYSRTGVVHIIAISGLHLALIYEVLQFFLKGTAKRKIGKWMNPAILLTVLWTFSFLSGASSSVMRSVVMFSFIIIGKSFSKSGSIYNSLTASAFLLLSYNPFWLWDVGFQLSYAAVLSLAIFVRPIYNWFYIKNKFLDLVWKSASVTIAAQILTVPLSIYHFHQFPNYFLITNLLAVPLSSLILLGELLICIASFLPVTANLIGSLISWMTWLLNTFIEHMENLPFSLWNGLYINIFQLVLFYLFLACMAGWVLDRNKLLLFFGLLNILFFFSFRTISFYKTSRQTILISYNIPRHQAVDFIEGRKEVFCGDITLLGNQQSESLYFQPARTVFRISAVKPDLIPEKSFRIFKLRTKSIIVVDHPVSLIDSSSKIFSDIIIVSSGAKTSIHHLSKIFHTSLWIFDASNTEGRIQKWKKECEDLGLSFYSVPDSGAFVMNLD
jgi:competence protein ComEC